MNVLGSKIVEALADLKNNYSVSALKIEFESEGASLEEAIKLKEIASNLGLDLTLKIGGCDAIRDLLDSKVVNPRNIVAPMIESPYALRKFTQAVQSVYSDKERKSVDFYINIETITGFNNLDAIINSPDFSLISGVVFGRHDMVNSMGMECDDVNSEIIFEMANTVSKKMKELNKEFVVGGYVYNESLPFFRDLELLTNFETRKIIFEPESLDNPNIDKAIIKAIEFEILWIKYIQKFSNKILDREAKRLAKLEDFISSFGAYNV